MSTLIDINGIIRVDTKQTPQTSGQYNGQARPGELVVDLQTYEMFIANLTGDLNPFDNPSGRSHPNIVNGTSNVSISTSDGNIAFNVNGVANVLNVSFNEITINGNLIPAANAVYSLGNATNQLKNLWLSGTTLYMNGAVITSIAGTVYLNGNQILTAGGSALNTTILNASQNIVAGGNLSITDNTIISGSLTTSGTMTTNGNLAATGLLSVNDLSTSGTTSAVGDITTNGNVSVTDDISGVDMNTSDGMWALGNITATGVTYGDRITSRTGSLTLSSIPTNTDIMLDPNGTGVIDASASLMTNILDPLNNTDLATKAYADSVVVSGYNTKDTVMVATTASLATLTGGSVTYNNGASGVGATITLGAVLLTVDGIPLTVGDRIMIKDETTQAYNGVYTYTSSTVLTRATDSDTAAELVRGSYYYIKTGATLAKQAFVINVAPTTVGTDAIAFLQVTGQSVVSAGLGLQLVANVLSIANTGVTSGTYGSGGANTLLITATNTGQITGISNSAITGGVSDLIVTNRLTAGNISLISGVTGAGNITTQSTLSGTELTVSKNATLGNNTTFGSNVAFVLNGNITDLRAQRMDVPSPGTLRYTDRTNVTNILYQDFPYQLNVNGVSTFNNVASFGLVDNITIPGGNSGATFTLSSSGTGSWGVPGTFGSYSSNVSTYSMNVAGQILPAVGLGASSTTTAGTITTPISWQGGDTTQIRVYGNTQVTSSAYGGGTSRQIWYTNNISQRGTVYAKSGYTVNDFKKRNNPILLEATFLGKNRIPLTGNGSGGFWLNMAIPENYINDYPTSDSGAGLMFYVSSTVLSGAMINTTNYWIKSSTLTPWFVKCNGYIARPVSSPRGALVYPQETPVGGFPNFPPPPLETSLYCGFDRPVLQDGTSWTLSILYLWPDGNTSKPTAWFFLNRTLVTTFSWDLYSHYDWIEGYTPSYRPEYSGVEGGTPYYYGIAAAGTSPDHGLTQVGTNFYYGSGQAFAARYLGSGNGKIYMPS